ncbi:MAG: RluA family pseudouridine synthase [Bacteroidota bacterium]
MANDHNPAQTLPESLFEPHNLTVDPGQAANRIDKFLTDRLPHTTRSKIQLAIENQLILVNQQPTKANYKVRPYDKIKVVLPTPPRAHEVLPERIPLSIVHEDASLLVVNKPAGMVVHPGHNNWTGTLVNALVYHFRHLPTAANNEGRPGLVHRIDKDTSGLLVIAKTEESLIALAKQFYDHSIERTYYALVWGVPEPAAGTIDVNLARSLQNRHIVAPYKDPTQGKRTITYYQVVKKLHYVSLVKCTLATGRTHQIRAHMQYLGHPIFGDTSYGGNQIVKGPRFATYKTFVAHCLRLLPRQALHAQALGFIHPVTQQPMHFEEPLPPDFQTVLNRWEAYTQGH